MGLLAPEPLTTVQISGPVHWTRFPACSLLHTDWSDHESAHRGVGRLFQTRLDGAPDARRAAAGILYRVDRIEGEPVAMVQSTIAPELLPLEARTMVVPARAWAMEAGARVRFRVAVNPLRRNKRRGTERIVEPDQVPGWLTDRIGHSVTGVEMLNHTRDTLTYQVRGRARRNAVPPVIVVDVLDATATVADPAVFDTLRRTGVGRAKAYGCGLLTAQRIG